ncbi:MAG: outer membrane transport energization protein TonB [Bacteroidetes bacterium]|nr:MAG: outer membrane transport energization protein TonB [Bacteroidota bacterium]
MPDTVVAEDTTVYSPGAVEKEASFPGGTPELMAYMRKTVKYPAVDGDSMASAHPMVAFIIEKDGSVSHVRPAKKELPPDPFVRELMRVVSQMPKWEPAQIAGKNVRIEFVLPMFICFKD